MNDFEWTEDSNLEEGEAWKYVVKNNRYSPAQYRKYMVTLQYRIKRIEHEMKQYDEVKSKENLSYEEWLIMHNGYKDNE